MEELNLEKEIVRHCAPTLANIKTASLFQFKTSNSTQLKKKLKEINSNLNKRDVYVEAMLWKKTTALLYTYRKTELKKDINNPQATKILNHYGYNFPDVDKNVSYLKKRLEKYSCFPHEIGLFLGYPPEDVKGFIENKGKNCKYCGFWKVYCNEEEACCLFDLYKKNTYTYVKMFSEGKKLEQLIV